MTLASNSRSRLSTELRDCKTTALFYFIFVFLPAATIESKDMNTQSYYNPNNFKYSGKRDKAWYPSSKNKKKGGGQTKAKTFNAFCFIICF